ncbi:ATP-binding protein [Phyllobacterium zundukense]|uniref:Winged helix-turn-helix domain-containing protein n=1 Tax=Phyllobacterium zundukense TaxID=1867719 RepID=A0ACD4D593_9HYPH|nr:winged helix-turn-helix domain-containing protein [Phyllobacterium zundukense]UXN60977.1 winged helix-turn-helix domain-containing protein [Phyllobacterium zundukense]
MRDETMTSGDEIIFGPFILAARKRLLTKDGVPVELGARALDILIALASRPNVTLSKKDLLTRAWPDVTVEEGSLRFHMANLRKALADGKEGARYIATLTGRGYCFVGSISRSSDQSTIRREGSDDFTRANLPSRLNRMVGRDDETRTLSAQVLATRFVTILGAGGVGKTTVAVALGHDLAEAFAGAVHFIDLGALSDPAFVATTVASILGLSVQSDDAVSSLSAYLADKRVLLILDTCEHVIESVAALSSRIYMVAPQVHILATSREAMRIEGEHVHKLTTLTCPPDDPGLTAAVAQTFAATQLFVERANSSGARLELSDADAAIVASICRKLDGVPLAIELAAARVGGLGLEKTAALLDHRLTLWWQGQRTAPQRQQTLQATMEWSYQLLSQMERTVLHRLAVFVGHFTIEAALAVVTSPRIGQTLVFGIVDSLVAKSMVATAPVGATMRYRLLDTTRAYALEASTDETELSDLTERHATYYLLWLEETGAEWPTLGSAAQRALYLAGLSNVRAAVESCFDGDGIEIGIRLAVAAAPVFLSMSLLTECHRWSERAILALEGTIGHEREEMHLHAASGVSLMFTRGGKDAARVALKRSFAIAEECGGPLDQLQVLGPLQMFHLRTGEFKAALNYANHYSTVAGTLDDRVSITLAHSLMGISRHLGGQLDGARAELEAALQPGPPFSRATIYLGFDGRILAGAILARNLWLQGYSDQAAELVRQTIAEAANKDHPLTLSIALIWAASLLLWTGDLEGADQYVDWLFSRARPNSLGPYLAVARGLKGELAIRRGNANAGVESLQAALDELHAAPYELLTTPLNIALVHGLAATNRFAEAFSLTETTIALVESRGDLCYMPELLRVKGNLSLTTPQAGVDEAERCFQSSIQLSRRQGARAWELRAGTDLAQLYVDRGQTDRARALLQPLCQQAVEGLATADVRAASDLLATLR